MQRLEILKASINGTSGSVSDSIILHGKSGSEIGILTMPYDVSLAWTLRVISRVKTTPINGRKSPHNWVTAVKTKTLLRDYSSTYT